MHANDAAAGSQNEKLSPSLASLNTAQFLGAMNDNILKLLIIFFLINAQGVAKADVITAAVGTAFVLPFLLFSAPAGCLADRLCKSRLIVTVKAAEVVVTLLAVLAFAFGWHNGLYLIVFLMATHSAFFAPAKYGVIPELAPRDQLSRANCLIESFTYLAIILGTALASVLTQAASGRFWAASLFCLGIALAGLWAAWRMEPTAAADGERRVALLPTEILRTVMSIRHDRDLMLAVIGLAWFMFVGAFAQLNLIGYGMQQMGTWSASSPRGRSRVTACCGSFAAVLSGSSGTAVTRSSLFTLAAPGGASSVTPTADSSPARRRCVLTG